MSEEKAYAKFFAHILPRLVVMRTIDGEIIAIAHVNELPPLVRDALRRNLADREIQS